jgi:hypothetical protein
VSKSHHELDSLLYKITAGPSKKQKHLSDDELSKLLYNHEPSDISESEFSDDSDMNVNMLSHSEQQATSDGDSANDNRDMQHDTWTRIDIERPCFPFSGKPGINVDLQD